MQTRRQHLQAFRKDGELATLGLAGVAHDAHDVTSARGRVNLLEIVLRRVLGVRHHLDLHPVAAQIVKVQLPAARALAHQATGDGDRLALACLALGDVVELLNERRELRVDVELVRVRGLAFLFASQDLVNPVRRVLRRVQLALLLLVGLLLLDFGRCRRRRGSLRILLRLRLRGRGSLQALLILAGVRWWVGGRKRVGRRSASGRQPVDDDAAGARAPKTLARRRLSARTKKKNNQLV